MTEWNFTVSPTTGIYDNSSFNIILMPSTVQISLIFMISLLMIVLNIPVFFIVPHVANLGNTGNVMLSLACTDVLLGTQSLTRLIINLARHNFYVSNDSFLCKLDGFANPFFATVSITHMTLINLDKLFSIQFPLRYRHLMTPRMLNIIMIGIWLGLCIFFSPVFYVLNVNMYESVFVCIIDFSSYPPYAMSLYLIAFVFPTTGIAIAAVKIYKIAQKQRHQIESLQGQHRMISKNDSQIILTLGLMTLSYYVLWIPYFILFNMWELATGHTFHPITDFMCISLTGLSSIANPMIYIPTIKTYRHQLLKLLHLNKFINTDDEESSNVTSNTTDRVHTINITQHTQDL